MKKNLVFNGTDEMWIDLGELPIERLVTLFQTTAIYQDTCNDLKRIQPELVYKYTELKRSSARFCDRLIEELGEDTAAMLIADSLLQIQLAK